MSVNYLNYKVLDTEDLVTKPTAEPTPEPQDVSKTIYPDALERYIVYRAGKKQYEIRDTMTGKTQDTSKDLDQALAMCQDYNQQELLDELGKMFEEATEHVQDVMNGDKVFTMDKSLVQKYLKEFQVYVLTGLQAYEFDSVTKN